MTKRKFPKKREWFTTFERSLIFDTPHRGWVHWIAPNKFVLDKSPFINHSTFYYYKTPSDIHPPTNSFVEVEVGKSSGVIEGKWGSMTPDGGFFEVQGIKYLDFRVTELGTPYLRDKEEFLARISWHWKNAHLDSLDLSLALQILSCPESSYGMGGIGTQSFSLVGTSKKPLRDIKRSINYLFPLNLKTWDSAFEFHFIETMESHSSVERKRKVRKISELSYNHLFQVPSESSNSVSIQIPTLIQNAEFLGVNKSQMGDFDVLDFVQTAFLIKPAVGDNMVPMIEKTIREIHHEIQPNYDGSHVPFDSHSAVKLANALCRLDLTEKLTEERLSSGMHEFRRLYKEFEDAKQDTLNLRADRRTYAVPTAKTSYAQLNLSRPDISIYRIIRKISEDEGRDWIGFDDIKNHERFTEELSSHLLTSLENLMNAGFIITRKNWLEFKYLKTVDMDD